MIYSTGQCVKYYISDICRSSDFKYRFEKHGLHFSQVISRHQSCHPLFFHHPPAIFPTLQHLDMFSSADWQLIKLLRQIRTEEIWLGHWDTNAFTAVRMYKWMMWCKRFGDHLCHVFKKNNIATSISWDAGHWSSKAEWCITSIWAPS